MGQLHKRSWGTSFRLWWMLQHNKQKARLWAMTAFGVSMAIAVAQIARGSSWSAIVFGSLLFAPVAFVVLVLIEYHTDRKRMRLDKASSTVLDRMGENLALKRLANEDDPAFRTRLVNAVNPVGNVPPAMRDEDNRPYHTPLKDWMGGAACPHCGTQFIPTQLAEKCPQCGLRPVLSETARQRLSPYLARGRVDKRPVR